MRKWIIFAMFACLVPAALAERIKSSGTRDPVMAGVEEATGDMFMIRVNSDGEIIVDASGGAGGLATEVTVAAILAKIIAAPSTEAKQDDLNALVVIIDAVLDAIKLDTANISTDQATETTAAAILAKIIAAPSTEAKQDDLNALIVIIDAVLDTIKLDTANISSDQATETTLAAVLAKLIAAPSTEAKQDTANAILTTINSFLSTLAGAISGSEMQADVLTLPSVLAEDSNNTTITPLGSGATFTGTATDLIANGNPHVVVAVIADQDSAAGGLVMQFSQDGTNWPTGSYKHSFELDANVARAFQFGPEAQFFRVVLTNGGVAQGTLRIQTILKRNIGYTTMHRVDDTIDADRSVIGITKSLSMVQKPDLTFTNRKATAGGVAKVAISEHEVALPAGTNLLGQIGAESPHFPLDSADATTGWTALGDASNIATSTTHIEGTLALEWDKAGGTEVTSGLQKTIDTEQTPGHATDVLLHCMLYIQDAPDLATVDFGFMRVGEDSSNYLQFEVDGVDMAVGWNHKNFTLTSPTSQTGAGLSTGIIKYMAFGVATNNAADTFDDMLGDDFHYDETLSAAVVSAPSSDVDLGSVRIRDRNSNTQMDVETDGANKAAHVMSNSMASESTLGTIDTDTGNIATSAASIDTNTSDNATQTTLALMNAKFVSGTDIGDVTLTAGAASIGTLGANSGVDIGDVTLTAGAASIGTLGANSGVDIGDVDVTTAPLPLGAPGQDHKAVVVTASAVEILVADAGRRFVTVCNAFTDLVALGNSDVTLNTAVATDGLVLAAAGAAGDGTGGCLTFETTTAIYAIGASANSKVNLLWGMN